MIAHTALVGSLLMSLSMALLGWGTSIRRSAAIRQELEDEVDRLDVQLARMTAIAQDGADTGYNTSERVVDRDRLPLLANGLAEWLRQHGHPHMTIHVTQDAVELSELITRRLIKE